MCKLTYVAHPLHYAILAKKKKQQAKDQSVAKKFRRHEDEVDGMMFPMHDHISLS